MAVLNKEDKQIERSMMISDYGRRRLLTYADSFQELASSFSGEFDYSGEEIGRAHV